MDKFERQSFATADLPEEMIEKIAASRMDHRHDHLNKLLDGAGDPDRGNAGRMNNSGINR